MSKLKTNKKQFSIGQIQPLKGLEGEEIITTKNQIAALSAAEAAILAGSKIKKVELPYVTVHNGRWSANGEKIFVGIGLIDVKSGKWIPNTKLSDFIKLHAYGPINTRIKTISWNKEGTFAAVLLDWTDFNNQETESVKLLVFNMKTDVPPVIIPETNISDVIIVRNHVVCIANVVSVWNLAGQEVAHMTPTFGVPFRVRMSENEDYFIILDTDWTARIIDTRNWNILAIWKGYFQDITFTNEGLIALDLKGQLHAACFSNGILEPIKQSATTGLSATQIVTAGDSHIIIMGMDSVPVHSVTFELKCANKSR